MQKIGWMFIAAVALFSCKKNEDFSAQLKPGPTDTAEIVGSWSLEASRTGFSLIDKDTTWKAAGTPATITFSTAGVFSADGGYAYKDQQYDRYIFDSTLIADFMLIATVVPSGNFPLYHGMVKLVNKDALIVTYMGVDLSYQELYRRQ